MAAGSPGLMWGDAGRGGAQPVADLRGSHSQPLMPFLWSAVCTAGPCAREGGVLGSWERQTIFLSQQNTQAVVCGRSIEHHWPCSTLVATANENAEVVWVPPNCTWARSHRAPLLRDAADEPCLATSPSTGWRPPPPPCAQKNGAIAAHL